MLNISMNAATAKPSLAQATNANNLANVNPPEIFGADLGTVFVPSGIW